VVGGPERPGGGRVAGQDPVQLGARAGALSHDFLLTTPYHSLRIDSIAQVITVALLFGTGLVASLAGRARRRQTVAAEAEAPVDADNLTQLDAEDHILDGRLRPAKGPVVRWVRPSQGAVLQLVQHRQPVGRLIVTFRQGQWIRPVIRLAWPPSPVPCHGHRAGRQPRPVGRLDLSSARRSGSRYPVR
jgi:hypothetical protein